MSGEFEMGQTGEDARKLEYANPPRRQNLSGAAKFAITLGILLVCGLGYFVYVMAHFLDSMD